MIFEQNSKVRFIAVMVNISKGYKMKRKRVVFIIIPIIVIIGVIGIVFIHHLITKDIQKKMFSDIEEFSKLEAYETGNANIEQPPSFSEYEILESYEKKILYDGYEYSVCAYVFQNVTDCYSYYYWIANQSSFDEPEIWDYCLNIGLSNSNEPYCDFVIYSGTHLYYIIGTDKDALVEFLNWLNADFKIVLK